MADTYKVLAQSLPVIATLTDAYTVPALTSTVLSSIVVTNQSVITAAFRISIAVAGAADTPAQYLYYDTALPANDTFVATLGISLATTDVVRVYSNSGNVSFNLFGVQVT